MTDFVAPQAGDMIKAISFNAPHTIDNADALLDIDVAVPKFREFDVLVEVRAVSVNPADTKIRQNHTPQAGNHRILGYDASGVVVALGRGVRDFSVGDKVYYARAIDRQGCNATY